MIATMRLSKYWQKQTGRYNEILDKRGAQGSLCGMDSEFIKKVFEAIHEESVRQQMEIINK